MESVASALHTTSEHGVSSITTADAHTSADVIIILINCNWVVTRWQWLFYMYTEYEIGY